MKRFDFEVVCPSCRLLNNCTLEAPDNVVITNDSDFEAVCYNCGTMFKTVILLKTSAQRPPTIH